KLADTGKTKEQLKDLYNTYFYETFQRFDFIADQGEGAYVTDENGRTYLDFMAGIAVNSTGHCNKRVVEAIIDQCQSMMHASNYCYTVPQGMTAELICKSIGMEKIYFQNSGAEANEVMMKLARKYGKDNFGPNRYEIVTALNSFHGRTLATLAATGQPGSAIQHNYDPFIPGIKYAEYNNLASFEAACDENTIAIMVEPVQGEGGVIPATKEFLEGLRKLCDERGMLLLFDEVQTGWGRTGSLMAFMGYGVKPDAVSMAKAMGGGLPIGAMCTSEKLARTFGPGAHGSTYAGNPVACAAAYAQISEIIDNNLSDNSQKVGAYFREKLLGLPHIKEVRGRGLMIGVEFDKEIATDVKYKACEEGLLITAVRPAVIRMVPPLNITIEECDQAFDILKHVVESLV
ncbi:MAG: aspartate aminotransferase family protein, partial [Lachnospiraceae bacterium]|nr:aspartate aminotransferase family protein [Lachnospiraceae bacterium]